MRFKGEALSKRRHIPNTVFVSVQGGDYSLLSPADEIDVTVYVKGCGPTRMACKRGEGSMANGEEVFEITVEQN